MSVINSSKYLDPSELTSLKALIRATRESSERDSLLIEVALRTGARAGEIIRSVGLTTEADGSITKKEAGIRKSDLIASENKIFIRGLKGSFDRDIGIKPEFMKRLLKHAAKVEGDYLFPISYQRLDQIWQQYRPGKASLVKRRAKTGAVIRSKNFHCLRHTYAIRLYQATKDIYLVQQALGHANISNTLVYMTVQFSRQDFKKMAL